MAGHPLRSATDRRFGGPLPRQLPNQTRVHPIPPELFTPYHAVLCAYAALAVISHCYSPVWGRLPTRYSPVRHSLRAGALRSFDLHVLSTPPAFILSQDQTLVKNLIGQINVMAYLFRFYLLGCCSLNVFKEFSGNPSSFEDFFKGFILTLFSYQGSCRC